MKDWFLIQLKHFIMYEVVSGGCYTKSESLIAELLFLIFALGIHTSLYDGVADSF
jgi:hypothetical protein